MKKLIKLGADGLITDRPDLMKEVLGELGFWKLYHAMIGKRSFTYPIGVATYTITANLPNDYIGLLPSPAEIRAKLQGLKEI